MFNCIVHNEYNRAMTRLGRIGLLLTRAVRHLAAQTFAAMGGFTVRDGLVGQ